MADEGRDNAGRAAPGKKKQQRLSPKVKRFIVEQAACYESPANVVKSVKEEFDLAIPAQLVSRYDPTTAAGRSLSEELKRHFWATRESYNNETAERVGTLNYRIGMLCFMAERLRNSGNYMAASQILEQVAKDKGGAFTSKRRIEIENPLGTLAAILGVEERDLPPLKRGEPDKAPSGGDES